MAARGGLCPRKALSPPCPEGKPFPPFAASPWPKSPVRGRARAGPEARNAERDGPRSPLSAPERGVAQCPWAPSRQDRAAASSPREAEPDPQLLLSGTRQLPGAVTAGPGPGLVCSHLPRAQEATCPKQEGATAECAVNEDVGNEFCSSTGSAKQPPNSQNRSEAVNARKKPRQFLGFFIPKECPDGGGRKASEILPEEGLQTQRRELRGGKTPVAWNAIINDTEAEVFSESCSPPKKKGSACLFFSFYNLVGLGAHWLLGLLPLHPTGQTSCQPTLFSGWKYVSKGLNKNKKGCLCSKA
ncbi:uncharacterized protein LOC134565388 isoform X3 [Prinia subflava]|uniref:uncharacterized protein LOC134565388 isoform X3 n=1 Tax=Prinia subflava TaxID=208062 RepID=UPI002FE38FD7